MQAMNLLAFDTCIEMCSAALFIEKKCVSFLKGTKKSRQTEDLLPLINSILSAHNISYNDIDTIACTVGPGSFTGVRIGISALQGITLVNQNCKTFGISTLQSMAWKAQHTDHPITCVLNARREQYYIEHYSIKNGLLSIQNKEIQLIEKGNLEKQIPLENTIVTDDHIFLSSILPNHRIISQNIQVDAKASGELALKLIENNENGEPLIPIYLRPPDAKKHHSLYQTSQ